jgi:DeoR family transcriptional regulator, suf operon transcriptional repressor
VSIESPHSDSDLLDLLRVSGPMRVTDMAKALKVTPTAIRQRLTRMMGQNLIQRETIRAGRGRPRHHYGLSEKGLRLTGSNFTDLALTLWREFHSVPNGDHRRETLQRIASALAAQYAGQIEGNTSAERMQSLSKLLAQRRIPASVQESPPQTTLTTHACPYPNLAEQDHGVCTMERLLFSELLGQEVQMTECRLEGANACRFQAK